MQSWGAAVIGEPVDLSHWAHVLRKPFDPWVEVHGNETILRSEYLDELKSASEVRDRALSIIDRLNGAIGLSQGARPLRFGGVAEFASNGRLHRTMFAETAYFDLRGATVSANVTVIGPDGKTVPPSAPLPSEVQKWARVADSDELLGDALVYFGRSSNWFDIYKTLECLILKFGPSEGEFLDLGGHRKTRF